jgi:flagellar P-ring protein precursor FlgI
MRCLRPLLFALAFLLALAGAAKDAPLRVKDLGKVQGWRDNVLVGTGIVTGLAGTGDSPGNRATRQALSNVLAQFELSVPPEQVNSRNVAVVMVSAALPAFAREGDALDVTVSSSGDARSLLGGNLLLTALRGPDGHIYALAQGPLSVGGHRYDANGNVVQKNHPTAGSIPNGATVEVGMAKRLPAPGQVTFVLAEPDYTTASRVVAAVNAQLGPGIARARDASGVEIAIPEAARDEVVAFLAQVENVAVEPDRRARVVINERTGTVVTGGDVRISRIAISHGDLKISIASQNSVSQPSFVGPAGPGVVSALVTNTQVDVEEPVGVGFLASAGTVSDLVQALARMKTSTRDIISILRAVKAAGALHGELVVQ